MEVGPSCGTRISVAQRGRHLEIGFIEKILVLEVLFQIEQFLLKLQIPLEPVISSGWIDTWFQVGKNLCSLSAVLSVGVRGTNEQVLVKNGGTVVLQRNGFLFFLLMLVVVDIATCGDLEFSIHFNCFGLG